MATQIIIPGTNRGVMIQRPLNDNGKPTWLPRIHTVDLDPQKLHDWLEEHDPHRGESSIRPGQEAWDDLSDDELTAKLVAAYKEAGVQGLVDYGHESGLEESEDLERVLYDLLGGTYESDERLAMSASGEDVINEPYDYPDQTLQDLIALYEQAQAVREDEYQYADYLVDELQTHDDAVYSQQLYAHLRAHPELEVHDEFQYFYDDIRRDDAEERLETERAAINERTDLDASVTNDRETGWEL